MKRERRSNKALPAITGLSVVLAVFSLAGGSAATADRAPRGYLTSPQELKSIAKQAERKVEPYATALSATVAYVDRMLARNFNVPAAYAFDHSSTTYPDWMNEMRKVAYGCALAYQLTDKEIYAQKAKECILALQKCRDLDATYQRQAMLNVSIHIPVFVFAADLLEGWEGWSVADRRVFQDWICNIAYPVSRRALTQSGGNWHAWAEGANLAFADYCWDRTDLRFRSEDPDDKTVFTAAEAWAYGRQEFFNQANGYNGATTATGADNKVLSQADILKKSMIRPDGGVPDELRRAQEPDSIVIVEENAAHNYMGFHRDGLLVACEIAYRRGDPSLYENIRATADKHYAEDTGVLVTLPAGRGSPRETLTFLAANQDKGGKVLNLNDGHKGSLEICIRRYKDKALPRYVDWKIENGQFIGGRLVNEAWPKVYVDRIMEQLQPMRPITDAWVPFTTLTHADPLGAVGEPPRVLPPGGELVTPAPPKGLTAMEGNGLVRLKWFGSPGALSYTVKRSTKDGSGYETVASGLKSTIYTDTGVANGQTYYYVITAVRGGNESQPSDQVSSTPRNGYILIAKVAAAAGEGKVILNPASGIYAPGTKVTLTATTNSWYKFTGWSGDAAGSDAQITVVMDANKTVVANFSRK